MEQKTNKKLIILTVLITFAITAVVFFGVGKFMGINSSHGRITDGAGQDQTQKKDSKEKKIIYWQAPMNPTEIYDEPGKSKMGMDLVPVYEDAAEEDSKSSERKIVYWKAPMNPTEIYDEPGQSKMGMDLVPVYEDELVGGVDIRIDPVVEQNMVLKMEKVERPFASYHNHLWSRYH